MSTNQPESFFQTVYLGDRACKGYALNSWEGTFRIQVDEISRIQEGSQSWSYSEKGNIENGYITFSGVTSVSFDPPGLIPNDYIEVVSIQEIGDIFIFRVELGCVDQDAITKALTIQVAAKDIYLEDPAYPGVKIR